MTPQSKRRHARRIFISYSRSSAQAHAVGLYQSLVSVLGKKSVFLDVGRDAMEAGTSWKHSIREALAKCDTLLLILDPGTTARLAEPDNAVLFELETALKEGVRIACVRVNDAEVPAANELPSSLAELPEWHSPEIHSDAVVADIERVVKEVTGRVPGEVPTIDRWDAITLGVLAALGAVGWVSIGQNLNLGERWLWGAALATPWLIWMAGRRAMPNGNRGRASRSYRQSASWLAVLVVMVCGCLLAGREMYRRHEFATDGGILVSRFAGDPTDQRQSELVQKLKNDDPAHESDRVAALPRRVGFNLADNPTDGDQKAQRYGSQAEAAVVLWGKVVAPAEGRLAVSLSFIESKEMSARRGLEVVGVMEARDLNGVAGNLDRLAATLPRLFDGYRLYRVAENERDLRAAESEFTRALQILEKERTGDLSGDPDARGGLDQIVASLRFLRANTRVFLGSKDGARADYAEAVDRTADVDGSPRYLEAASNLGWLLKGENKLEEAVGILDAIDLRCRVALEPACAYAAYNLGDALSDQGRHEEASQQFKQAIERLSDPGQGSEDPRLEANSSQYLAYSLLRLASASAGAAKASLLEEAQRERERAETVLASAGLEVPEYFRITLGRILIEQGEWQPAIDELASLEVPAEWQASVHALLAGASSCLADTEQLQAHLLAIPAAVLSCPPDTPSRISIGEGMAEVGRIKEMCPEASQAGA